MNKTIQIFLARNTDRVHSVLREEGRIRKDIETLLKRMLSHPDRTMRLILESILIHSGEILRNLHQILINTIK
ncbi:MAG: hypothetical protein ACTSSA_03720 [Candidatus Freyarchaeota archaeon]